MSAIADLDIKLSEYKLSDAQKNAVLELMEGPLEMAKPNTIKSLEKKGIIQHDTSVLGLWSFTEEFAQDMGWAGENEHTSMFDVGVQMLEDISEAQAVQEVMFSGGEAEAPFADGIERFQDCWADWQKKLAGFGETLSWKNSRVWDGLTAEEIRADMDTAGPINRKARRASAKITRKLVKALTKVG